MMFKKFKPHSWCEDLRKLGVAYIIGGGTGIFLQPGHHIVSASFATVLGIIIWFLGLKKEGDL